MLKQSDLSFVMLVSDNAEHYHTTIVLKTEKNIMRQKNAKLYHSKIVRKTEIDL